ncbi:MAG: DUF86 domain-containing protein [Alphaproteobacteria bacterium]|nr:DUF86 domain-containing protein [Alphaproteobacteria bacterium]
MNEQRLPDLLATMHRAAFNALSFVNGIGFEEFLSDIKTQQAVVMSLIVIGENSARAIAKYPSVVDQFDQIPWRSMRGMRNRIAHNYDETNFEIVWKVILEELPKLILNIEIVQKQLNA